MDLQLQLCVSSQSVRGALYQQRSYSIRICMYVHKVARTKCQCLRGCFKIFKNFKINFVPVVVLFYNMYLINIVYIELIQYRHVSAALLVDITFLVFNNLTSIPKNITQPCYSSIYLFSLICDDQFTKQFSNVILSEKA